MSMLSIGGIAIVASAFSVLLGQYNKEWAMMLTITTGIVIFITILSNINPVICEMQRIVSMSKLNGAHISILLKTLGVCFITQFASDCCRDAGQTALASKVELAGKFTIVVIALPLFVEISEMALHLMSGGI